MLTADGGEPGRQRHSRARLLQVTSFLEIDLRIVVGNRPSNKVMRRTCKSYSTEYGSMTEREGDLCWGLILAIRTDLLYRQLRAFFWRGVLNRAFFSYGYVCLVSRIIVNSSRPSFVPVERMLRVDIGPMNFYCAFPRYNTTSVTVPFYDL